MAKIKIDGVNRNVRRTKDDSREYESVGVLPVESEVMDVNGDMVELDGRWLNGFRDKEGETDQWEQGMTINIQIIEVEYTRKDGSTAKAMNFKLPEGKSSIVEQAEVVEEKAIEPEDF